jgi:hypothetical protein
MSFDLSMNTKSPVGMAVPVLAATTAVKVTGWFTVVGLADEVRLDGADGLWDAGRQGDRVSVQRDARARTFPRRMEQVPSVAELPTLRIGKRI